MHTPFLFVCLSHFRNLHCRPSAPLPPRSVPRLDGGKMGVFATRSPHRPCPVGLSVARVVAVEGRTLVLGGADIVDGERRRCAALRCAAPRQHAALGGSGVALCLSVPGFPETPPAFSQACPKRPALSQVAAGSAPHCLHALCNITAAASAAAPALAPLRTGSPVLDIKPYVPFCDSVPPATAPHWVTMRVRPGPAVAGATAEGSCGLGSPCCCTFRVLALTLSVL